MTAMNVVSTASRLRISLKTRGWLMLITSNICFAGAYVSGKFGLTAVSPVTLNTLRFLLAACVLAPIVWRQRALLPRRRADRWTFVAIALFSFVLNKLFEYLGVNLTTASDSALLIAGEGLFTSALAWLVLRERITLARVVALLFGFTGAYLIIERGLIPQLGGAGGLDRRILGDGLFLLSLTFEAFANILSKRLAGAYSPLLVTSATVVGSLAVWIPAGSIDIALHGVQLTWPAVGGIAYLGLVVTVVGYFLWFAGLQVIDGSAAAATLFIQPLLGTLLALWILHEPLSLFTLIGGASILFSVWLTTRPPTFSHSQPGAGTRRPRRSTKRHEEL